jgi:putative ABC transport system substrate-binding protein
MNNRRKLVLGLGAGTFTVPLFCFAQTLAAGSYRIGYLTSDSQSADLPRREAFMQGLSDLGYREKKNIIIEYQTSEGRNDKFPELAAELHRLKVDVIFAFSSAAVEAAKKEMPTIPIVSVVPDPVAAGFAASLARPGGSITGLSTLAGQGMFGKYLGLLKEIVPKLARVAILSNPTNPYSALALKETESVAKELKLSIRSFNASTPADLEKAFIGASKERVGGLLVVQDAMFLGKRTRVAELAAKYRLPAIYGIQEHAEAGGLMAYAASRPEIFRRAATYIDKILKGAKPADLPIEQPTKFALIINRKTAKALGLTIPQTLLVSADKVIE